MHGYNEDFGGNTKNMAINRAKISHRRVTNQDDIQEN